jgi:Fe-S cluster assembly iron-binding protein IscA
MLDLSWDNYADPDDVIFTVNGQSYVMDSMTSQCLSGSTIDYRDGSMFITYPPGRVVNYY